MNDKLKELKELATGLALAEMEDVCLRRLYREIYEEKFAELIVRECISVGLLAQGERRDILGHFGMNKHNESNIKLDEEVSYTSSNQHFNDNLELQIKILNGYRG
jgi:hypothetical protein